MLYSRPPQGFTYHGMTCRRIPRACPVFVHHRVLLCAWRSTSLTLQPNNCISRWCLAGTAKQLPEGYQGLLLKPAGGAKPGSSSSDTQQRSWQAVASFQQLTVWNHDNVPAASDWHMRCIDFLALADKVGNEKRNTSTVF
jgi:hypothetical protein